MSNCHSLFSDFNNVIRLNPERRAALLAARNDLRVRIDMGFSALPSGFKDIHKVQFQTQGSFIMDTIINPISEDYDLDEGVYFIGALERSNRGKTTEYHNMVKFWVQNDNHFVEKVSDKDTCVRAHYREGYSFLFENKQSDLPKGFHIDLPVYYAKSKACPDLAHQKEGWIVSDPIEFIRWFEDKVGSRFHSAFLYEREHFKEAYIKWRDDMQREDAQLRRIVRYLKAWCDYKGSWMPCGIILTILAAEDHVPHERDDESLYKTLEAIHNSLSKSFICKRPTTPEGENLLAGYDRQDDFMAELASFTRSAKLALAETNQKRACGKWQLHFGDRFNCAAAMDLDIDATTYSAPAILTGNAKSA